MSDDRISAKDFPAVQQAKEATKKALEYYRRMGSMDYQITEPERTAAELQRLRAENERLRQDAERYRWLRARYQRSPDKAGNHVWYLYDDQVRGPTVDAAIDAAMKREGER